MGPGPYVKMALNIDGRTLPRPTRSIAYMHNIRLAGQLILKEAIKLARAKPKIMFIYVAGIFFV